MVWVLLFHSSKVKSQYRPDCYVFSRIDNMGQPISQILAVAPKEALWWRQPFCLCDCDEKLLLTLPGLCWVVVRCSVAISFRRCPGLCAGCAGGTQLLRTAFPARALFLGTEEPCFLPPPNHFCKNCGREGDIGAAAHILSPQLYAFPKQGMCYCQISCIF